MQSDPADAWLAALIERHTRQFTRPEFLKAVRALSARYVERRADLAHRPPTDSAGKRAAFAAFFAPLHFVTIRALAPRLGVSNRDLGEIVDLGCGTGTASAGWAVTQPNPPAILGLDRDAWALDEAAWNWRTLGLQGRTRRVDLGRAVPELAAPRRESRTRRAMLAAWSANELSDDARAGLLTALLAAADNGDDVLVVEPIARRAAPPGGRWADAWGARGGRADEWKVEGALPSALAEISEAAGFRRDALAARTLWLPGSIAGPVLRSSDGARRGRIK
jgi:SAM-dependent methyltransferase